MLLLDSDNSTIAVLSLLDHPRNMEWLLSITTDLPLFKSEILDSIILEIIPIKAPKNNSPITAAMILIIISIGEPLRTNDGDKEIFNKSLNTV